MTWSVELRRREGTNEAVAIGSELSGDWRLRRFHVEMSIIAAGSNCLVCHFVASFQSALAPARISLRSSEGFHRKSRPEL